MIRLLKGLGEQAKETAADVSTYTGAVVGLTSFFAQWEPVITACGALVAILGVAMSMYYHWKKARFYDYQTKRRQRDDQERKRAK